MTDSAGPGAQPGPRASRGPSDSGEARPAALLVAALPDPAPGRPGLLSS